MMIKAKTNLINQRKVQISNDFKIFVEIKINVFLKGLKKSEIELKKAGVVYLSRIPTKMNVRIIREYLSKFGEVDRVFLEPRGTLIEIILLKIPKENLAI